MSAVTDRAEPARSLYVQPLTPAMVLTLYARSSSVRRGLPYRCFASLNVFRTALQIRRNCWHGVIWCWC